MQTLPTLTLPVHDRADLAVLVAHPMRPRPFYIDAGNDNAGYAPSLAEAIATGYPYAVTVAPDVLAYDLDTDDADELAALLAAELILEGWPVLRTYSGRAGHRHLFAVVPHPAARARVRARLEALGAPAPRDQIRPPGAPHRHGLPVDVLDDVPTFAAAVAAVRAAAELDHEGERARLDWRDLLASGRWPRGWKGEGSGSSMVWHIAIGAIRAGHRLEDVRAMLANELNAGGAPYRARLERTGRRHGDYWLEHYVWPSSTKAAGRNAPADATEARERLHNIFATVTTSRWSGIAGATDRAVLVALLARAHARGSMTPTMSYREIAEAAPCTPGTVTRAVRRLAAAGWLQVADRGRGRTELTDEGHKVERAHATRWRLLDQAARPAHIGGTPPSTPLSVCISRGGSLLDAGRWRGLGLNAPRVLDALASGPLSSRAVADLLGLNEGNLRARLLPRLAAHGLVEHRQDGWTLADNLEDALDRAADELGLTGKAATVAAAHDAERATFLEAREQTRPLREAARARDHRDAVAARRERAAVPLPLLEAGAHQHESGVIAHDS